MSASARTASLSERTSISLSERTSIVSRRRVSSAEDTTSATCLPPAITATVSPRAALAIASSHDAVCLLAACSSSAETSAA